MQLKEIIDLKREVLRNTIRKQQLDIVFDLKRKSNINNQESNILQNNIHLCNDLIKKETILNKIQKEYKQNQNFIIELLKKLYLCKHCIEQLADDKIILDIIMEQLEFNSQFIITVMHIVEFSQRNIPKLIELKLFEKMYNLFNSQETYVIIYLNQASQSTICIQIAHSKIFQAILNQPIFIIEYDSQNHYYQILRAFMQFNELIESDSYSGILSQLIKIIFEFNKLSNSQDIILKTLSGVLDHLLSTNNNPKYFIQKLQQQNFDNYLIDLMAQSEENVQDRNNLIEQILDFIE